MINKQKLKEITPYLTGIVLALLFISHIYQYTAFMNKGPRFTAYDGQELCERIKSLEADSYEFRDSDRQPLTCNYASRVQP